MLRLRLLVGIILFSLVTGPLFAQGLSTRSDPCMKAVHSQMEQQWRIYRQILFGRKKAEKEVVGNTRFDKEGNAWIKVSNGSWRSQAKGYEGTTWSDTQLDNQTEWEGMNELDPNDDDRANRLGIFEAKEVLTSQYIVPAATQAYRALQCRLQMVCEGIKEVNKQKVPRDSTTPINVKPEGCEELTTPPLSPCSYPNLQPGEGGAVTASNNSSVGLDLDVLSQQIIQSECLPLKQDIMLREIDVLRLSVGYDAAYRSLLQFSGSFDAFIFQFRGDFLRPLEQAMPLLEQLTRIPCFLAQCNG